jgi:hypothetical protein
VRATEVFYTPLHPDELNLKGRTFEHTITFESTDKNGNKLALDGDVSIFVPLSVSEKNKRQVGLAHNVLIFFTANYAVGDNTLNDLLTHGLRASAENYDYVLITLPSPGQHPDVPFDRPDFNVIRDSDILGCLAAVELNASVGKIRMAAHSRGYAGLTRTLMGNDEIGEVNLRERDTRTATIKTPFLDYKRVEKLFYFDDFFPGAQRIIRELVFRGLSKDALIVYHVVDGIIIDKQIVTDMTKQFVRLGLESNDRNKLSIDDIGIATLGCLRFLNAAISVNAALNKNNVTLSTKLLKNDVIMKLMLFNPLPQRGTFSAADFSTFYKGLHGDEQRMKLILNFLNQEDLVRARKIGYSFDGYNAAHHFFVCEFVHELFK